MNSTRGPRLVLIGKQGAGKGTQAKRIAERFHMQHLSTGQLFRDSAAAGIDAGLKAKKFMDRGDFVPDEIVIAVVEERFANPKEVEHGFVLDGFPRTETQAVELDRILGSRTLDLVLNMEVPTEIVMARLASRKREDDTEEGIRRRLELYETETKPLVDFYDCLGLLVTVNGVGEEDEIFGRMLAAIETRLTY